MKDQNAGKDAVLPAAQPTETQQGVPLTFSMDRFKASMMPDASVIITAPPYRGQDGGRIHVSAQDFHHLVIALQYQILPAMHEQVNQMRNGKTESRQRPQPSDPDAPTA